MDYCTRCGHPAGGEAGFCISCGAPLAADDEQDWGPPPPGPGVWPGPEPEVWAGPEPTPWAGAELWPEPEPGAASGPGLRPGAAPEPASAPGRGPGLELSSGNVRLIGGGPAPAAGEATLLGEVPPVTSPDAAGGHSGAIFPATAASGDEPGQPGVPAYAAGSGYADDAGQADGPGEDTAAWLPGFTLQAPLQAPLHAPTLALPLRQPARPVRAEPPAPRRPLLLPAPAEDDALDRDPVPSLPPPASGGRAPAWLTIAVVFVMIAAGLGTWYYFSRPYAVPAAAAQHARAASRPHRGAASPLSRPSPGRTARAGRRLRSRPAGAARGSRPVTLGPGVTGLSVATPVAAFLAQYFAAINDHDYPAFSSLFEPGASPIQSAADFRSGYGTSRDSPARLVSLAQTTGGVWAAALRFDSHQLPGSSATHTSCTAWAVTLYLVPVGNSYLIGPPPLGYQAAARPCG